MVAHLVARAMTILCVAVVTGCSSDEPFTCTIDHCSVDEAAGTACCPSKSTDGRPACCAGPQVHLTRRACHPATKQCYTFCTGCTPPGWAEPDPFDGGMGE